MSFVGFFLLYACKYVPVHAKTLRRSVSIRFQPVFPFDTAHQGHPCTQNLCSCSCLSRDGDIHLSTDEDTNSETNSLIEAQPKARIPMNSGGT
jgi:hypothetical protein